MVRDMETFYPRKEDMGNGPIELVLGNVLDKVSEWQAPYCVASMCLYRPRGRRRRVVVSFFTVAVTYEPRVRYSTRRGSAAQGRLKEPVRTEQPSLRGRGYPLSA